MNKKAKATTYHVTNRYGIRSDTVSYRVVGRALAAAQRREGDGWEVWDSDGCRWVEGPTGPIACLGW
jgi:hypothetical protein